MYRQENVSSRENNAIYMYNKINANVFFRKYIMAVY